IVFDFLVSFERINSLLCTANFRPSTKNPMKTLNYFVDRTRNSQLRKKPTAMHHGILTIPPLDRGVSASFKNGILEFGQTKFVLCHENCCNGEQTKFSRKKNARTIRRCEIYCSATILRRDIGLDPVPVLTTVQRENKGKVVLEGVTGHVRSGEVTAVMGPSGAGKTTFLNTLSGKAYYGNANGKILFNNEVVRGIKQFRSITGFVPQEDTMHRNLTVHEVLYYQALLRLPAGTNKRTINYKIRQTLDILEISHVADSLIGDEETRGISGGQRKRVNIGMELIADPTLLFLDEPTSGLDSTSSLSVLKSLRAVAEEGKLTVLCVIHQPRFEIFNMFHNILLLGPGGKTVYQGNVSDAAQYFSSLGFNTPANVNPADFYMDVIGGSVDIGDEEIDLFEAWKNKSGAVEGRASSSGEEQEFHVSSNSDPEAKRVLPNPLYQFVTFTKREFLLQIRLLKTLLIDVFLVFFAGGVLGALYLEVKLEKFTGLTRMSGMAIGLTAMLAALRCFGNHRTTFWRESAAGVNRVSYFLAVNFAQMPILVMMPLVYLSLLYTLTSPRSYFSAHYTAVFCAQLCCSGLGYAISTIFNPKSSQMASVVVILVMAMLSGFSPTLCKLDDLDFFGPVGYSLSYIRWFVEALFEKEALRYPDVDRPIRDAIAFPDHYTLDGNYSFCLGMIVVMASRASGVNEDTICRGIQSKAKRLYRKKEQTKVDCVGFKATALWIRKIRKSERLQDYFARQEIRWRFNLSKSPWWGGMYERLLKDIKKPFFDQLQVIVIDIKENALAIVIDIEGNVNNRPLTYVESEQEEEKVLTPILWGQNVHTIDESDTDDGEEVAKLHKRMKQKREHAWQRWKMEYLHSLMEHHRVIKGENTCPEVGEMILVVGEERNRAEWKRGKVVELIKGKDNVFFYSRRRVTISGDEDCKSSKL
ncbi:white-brown complex homolog 30, partial [Paramuricea clavata]